ncbi:MAG: SpoIID/LytB domain-containing protein [Clostridiales bacterium]|nr:SpoIID/LytB domain-containing protein [Clostridiales bacterium]
MKDLGTRGILRRALAMIMAAALLLPCGAALAKGGYLPAKIRKEEAAKPSDEPSTPVYEGRGIIMTDFTDPLRGINSLSDVRAPAVTEDFSTIRVLITTGGVSYVNLALCGEYYLPENNILLSGSADTPINIKISASGSTVTITNVDTEELLASGEAVELLRVYNDYQAGYATLTHTTNQYTQGASYLGNFTFKADSGKVKLINTVPMAYYLFGIIGYELSPSSKPEALKAQAIAAKTFGIFFMNASAEYDVQDGWTSSMYQGYRGYKEDRLSTMQYCLGVIGQTIAYNNKFIPAFYGHTDGGETALPSQIFNANDTRYDGGFSVELDDIEFNNYAPSKQLINVTFGGTGDSSRFRDFILSKINDLNSVSAANLVSIDELYAFEPLAGTQRNMQKLHVTATVSWQTEVPDPTPTPEPTPDPTEAPTEAPSEEPTGDPTEDPGDTNSRAIITVTQQFTFECPIKQLRTYALTDVDGSGDDYSSSKYVFTKNFKLFWGKTKTNGYTLILSRNGNGIGLSQIGANIRANPSTYAQNYLEILAFYYPNFNMISITEIAPSDLPTPTVAPPEIVAYGVCTDNNTNFRMGPSTSYPSMGKVQANEHLDIVGACVNGWYKAIWNGKIGYIIMDYSKIIMFPAPRNGVFTLIDGTARINCNLRQEPFERETNIITRIPKDTPITCWAKVGKFYYVTTGNGYAGFMHQDVLTLGDPYEYLGMASLLVKEYPLLPPPFSSLKPSVPKPGASKQRERG